MVSKGMAVRIGMERKGKDGHIPLFAIIIGHLKLRSRLSEIHRLFFQVSNKETRRTRKQSALSRWNEMERDGREMESRDERFSRLLQRCLNI